MTPLALEMLCRLELPANIGGSPEDAAAMAELDGLGLASAEHTVITDRGKAMLAILCATPLPVQQWVDPRENMAALHAAHPLITVTDPGLAGAAMARHMGAAAAHRTRPLDIPAIEVTIPPNYTPIPDDLKPGELPAGLDRDNNVDIFMANGKRKVFLAQTVNWTNRGKVDSPVAYRDLGPEPEEM